MSNKQVSIPLQNKVSLTLVLLITVFVVVSYTILRAVIAPAFDELELGAARSDMHRAEAALRTDIENLETVVTDWAQWDDIYRYVNGENPGFEKSNLDRSTLETLGLDLMAVYAADGRIVWSQLLIDGEETSTDALNILNPNRPEALGLTAHRRVLDSTAGFVQTVYGPMIISSRPILHTDDSGPIAGAVVMAHFLNDSLLARLQERTEVVLSWGPAVDQTELTVDAVFDTAISNITAAKLLLDIHGEPVLVLRTLTSRNISSLGAHTVNAATLFLIITGVLVCGFIWFTLRHTILLPCEQLATHINEIRKSGDLSRQLCMTRG
ncbi:MAG: hypothetical protein GY924_04810, partial [Planctomycetaceae bacterium]|nr:hypothetical protein [Planctomycetaceae bacterium]